MRDKVRFPGAVVALMLSAGCAPSGVPSGSEAGGAATPTAPTTPPQTVSSPAASPVAASRATAVPKVAVTLFKNVRIFDGKAEKLTDPGSVMVRGNIIERVSSGSIETPADADVTVIDGGGRTLMPGLIDAHWHAMLVRPPVASLLTADAGYLNLLAGAEATDTLLRGFTTVRDVGGPTFGLKQAIDQGVLVGPRIFPSGAIITITGGHGDFRPLTDLPRTLGGPLTRQETTGASMVADSPDEVRVRVREQLMQGALLAKLTKWYTPAEALVMATGTNAQLLAMSGKRSPYPGKLGVVEEGALADLLLVDGNPIADIKLVADPARNFVLIMKDGKIYKNTLSH